MTYVYENGATTKVDGGFLRDANYALVTSGTVTMSVTAYGAVGDGVTDDRAAIQAAITAAEAVGGIVDIPAGTFLLNSTGPLRLAPAAGVTIRGAGIGATTIKLSSSASSFLCFNKAADHDVFSDIDVSDLTVDKNNVAGNTPVIVGTRGLTGTATNWTRISFDRLSFKRIRAINVPVDNTITTSHQRGLLIASYHVAVNEGTQDYVKNILVEDVTVEGGNIGFAVIGMTDGAATGTNIYMDNIEFRRCRHHMGAIQTAAVGQLTGFQVGQDAFGGRCRIVDCYSYGSADVAYEVDNMEDVWINEGTVAEEFTGNAFYFTNFNYPSASTASPPSSTTSTINQQMIRCSGVAKRRTALAGSTVGSGFRTAVQRSLPLGTVILDGKYHRNEPLTMPQVNGEAVNVGCPALETRVSVSGIIEGLNVPAGATGSSGSLFFVQNSTHNRVVFKDCYARVSGVRDTSLADPALRLLELRGTVTNFDVDGFVLDLNLTKSDASAWGGNLYGLLLGNSAATTRGRISRLYIANWTGNGSSWRAIAIGGSLTLSTYLEVAGCDTQVANGGKSIDWLSSPTNRDRVIAPHNQFWESTAVASAGTVTLPPGGEYFTVTGTTTITSITKSWPGRRVTLNFGGALTFTDGSNLLLAGNLVTTADDTITLVGDGTNWIEVARSVN